MQKKAENLLYSGGGLVAAFVILILANLVLGAARGRIDLTQGKLFTLSEGTRAVLSKLESPVKIRLYFTQGDAGAPAGSASGRRRSRSAPAARSSAGRIGVNSYSRSDRACGGISAPRVIPAPRRVSTSRA